jgi:hypothetical protein
MEVSFAQKLPLAQKPMGCTKSLEKKLTLNP